MLSEPSDPATIARRGSNRASPASRCGRPSDIGGFATIISKRRPASAANQSLSSTSIATPCRAALSRGDPSASRESRSRHLRVRAIPGNGDCKRSRSGCKIEHANVSSAREARERKLDQQFGLGSGINTAGETLNARL